MLIIEKYIIYFSLLILLFKILIFIEFKIKIEKIIRMYMNNMIRVIISININKIILFIFIIINILGKNPKNGGNPPIERKFININILIKFFLKLIL